MIRLAMAVATITLTAPVCAAPQPKGFILNSTGQKCWFTQQVEQVAHFQTIPAPTSTLVFADPRCMSATGLDAEINVRMINLAISRWYSHPDAEFAVQLGELRKSSPIQVRGKCMQSRRYPTIGVALEYFQQNGYLVGAKHAPAAGACTEP